MLHNNIIVVAKCRALLTHHLAVTSAIALFVNIELDSKVKLALHLLRERKAKQPQFLSARYSALGRESR